MGKITEDRTVASPLFLSPTAVLGDVARIKGLELYLAKLFF